MITTDQALFILQETIRKGITHPDYQRVTELATWYHKVITGKDIESLLRRFVRREDDTMFEQRKALTVEITPSISETLINPFYRVGRLDNVKKTLTYPDGQGGADKKIDELNTRIGSFWGNESLDKYLNTRFIQLLATDPNAWLVVEFKQFDARYEKAKPYPTEFSASEAVNFSIENNETQWLIIKQAYSLEVNGIVHLGYRYIMYLPNDILIYTPDFETTTAFSDTGIEFWRNAGQNYQLSVYQPRGGMVQAMRIGYKLDGETNGRTFVNPFHAAKPYFDKSIKSVSELDISVSLHVHMQKIQREQACPGTDESTCNQGRDLNGGLCKACGGSGEKVDVSTTGQDIIRVPWPKRNDTPEQKVALNDVVAYVQGVPIGIVDWLDKYIDKLEVKAIKAVYNSDVISKTTIAQTATERLENKDEMYNTLQPFAEHFSSVWRRIVKLIAAFTDNGEGLKVSHDFPSDFKLKTVAELYQDLKLAKDSGASAFVIQQIEKDIAEKLYIDDPNAFLKFRVKDRFMPFRGKTSEEVFKLMETGRVRKVDEILWTYSDTIFDDLENEVPGFFLFTYEKQWAEIQRKVAEIQETLPKDTMAISFTNGSAPEGEEVETPVDAGLDAALKLRGTASGTDSLLKIQESVAKGVTLYNSGLAIIMEQFKFDEPTARRILGDPIDLSTKVKQGEIVV